MKILLPSVFLLMFLAAVGFADEVAVRMSLVTEHGVGREIGMVTAKDSLYGLILTPRLSDLAPGIHGFHVHEKPACNHAMKEDKAVAALAAGGHYDPSSTGKHEGPYGGGHLGDLPALFVTADGKAMTPILAPRLKAADLRGRSIMIHAGGDNYSDVPEKLGGGGARMACGVVQ